MELIKILTYYNTGGTFSISEEEMKKYLISRYMLPVYVYGVKIKYV